MAKTRVPFSQAVHCVIDIETLGTDEDAVVLSLGAALFNWSTAEYSPEMHHFYETFDVGEQPQRSRSDSTLRWWNSQPRAVYVAATSDTLPVQEVLIDFYGWLREYCGDDFNKLYVWGNGNDFDNKILGHLANQFGRPLPWDFRHNCNYRTLAQLYDGVAMGPFVGTKHYALDDAVNEAIHLKRILEEHYR